MARVLYITYDGLMEPLGKSQVFQYLKHLAQAHDIFLLSYEKPDDWSDAKRREDIRRATREAGICWMPLGYHSKPSALATAYDIAAGFLLSLVLIVWYRIQVVHARSYVASVIALGLKKALGTEFIFDMRGFWADERVERGGLPKESRLYRTAKWFERRFLEKAGVVVSLTHAAANTIGAFPYLVNRAPSVKVIPTCTDLEKFRLAPTVERTNFILGYVGSADTAYLFEPVLRCFKIVRGKKKGARLLVVTRTSHEYVGALLQQHGIDRECVELKSVAPGQVAAEMVRMDAGIFFVKPGFSACASVPTKLGEFLGCGVPCLANSGVGDIETILEEQRVGVVLREFSPEAEAAAVCRLLELCAGDQTRERCAQVARRFFSLEAGVQSYDRIYRFLSGAL
jgi:glycosyltransferase involved in cell wall biosynthesis